MFDFHIHSKVSFDGHNSGLQLAQAALDAGLKEICFTDHMDYIRNARSQPMIFTPEEYSREYDGLELPGLLIRRGVEYGLYDNNQAQLKLDLARREYDFVLGSVHFVDDLDVYFAQYWEGKTVQEAERRFLEETLNCVRLHEDFDVLAHLTFLSKAKANPTHSVIRYENHRELIDEILQTLAVKGKGLELNTSGLDRCGGYLPTADYFRRFKELGGQIVTVGSDAHRTDRVGQYTQDACRLLQDIFGYVCTFQNRQPIFHRTEL